MTPFLVFDTGKLHWMSVGNGRIADVEANTSIWIDNRQDTETASNRPSLPSTTSRRIKLRECAKIYCEFISKLVHRWEELLDVDENGEGCEILNLTIKKCNTLADIDVPNVLAPPEYLPVHTDLPEHILKFFLLNRQGIRPSTNQTEYSASVHYWLSVEDQTAFMEMKDALLATDLAHLDAFIAPSTLGPNTGKGLFYDGNRTIQADTIVGYMFGGLSYHNLVEKEKVERYGTLTLYFTVDEWLENHIRIELSQTERARMMVQDRMSVQAVREFAIVPCPSCAFCYIQNIREFDSETGEPTGKTINGTSPNTMIRRNRKKQYDRANMTDHTHYQVVSTKQISPGDEFLWDYADVCKLSTNSRDLNAERAYVRRVFSKPQPHLLRPELRTSTVGRGLGRKRLRTGGASAAGVPKMKYGPIRMSTRNQRGEDFQNCGAATWSQESEQSV